MSKGCSHEGTTLATKEIYHLVPFIPLRVEFPHETKIMNGSTTQILPTLYVFTLCPGSWVSLCMCHSLFWRGSYLWTWQGHLKNTGFLTVLDVNFLNSVAYYGYYIQVWQIWTFVRIILATNILLTTASWFINTLEFLKIIALTIYDDVGENNYLPHQSTEKSAFKRQYSSAY